MPYYHEVFLDDGLHDSRMTWDANTYQVSNNAPKVTSMYSFRTGASKASYYAEYYEHEVDPYRHFITGVMDRRRPRGYDGPIDTGHSFSKVDRKVIGSRISGTTTGRVWSNCYPTLSSHPAMPVFPDVVNGATLEQFAQSAYSSSVPKQSAFDGAQLLGELQEGLPSLPLLWLKNLKRNPQAISHNFDRVLRRSVKESGAEWVNLQFAMKPFVSELWKLTEVLFNFDKKYRELISNTSMPIHRERYAPVVETMSEAGWATRNITLSNLSPTSGVWPTGRTLVRPPVANGVTAAVNVAAQSYALSTTRVERWFEGSFATFFRYPLESAPFVEKAAVMLGLTPNIQTFWELAPWSWLVDWLFSIQSTLAANTAGGDESILMNYGYVMETISMRTLLTGRWTASTTALTPLNVVYESTRKRRIRANPFGFQAKTPTGLSAQQWSILAALGANRL